MAKRKSDIPFGQDPASRLMPWVVAVMIYVAGLAISGAFVLSSFAERWEAGLTGSLTVQIPPPSDAALDDADRDELIAQVMRAIRSTPGVDAAEALPDEEMRLLLEPWLGTNVDPRDLPLPILISVDLIDGVEAGRVDLADLRRRLEAVAPGALIDDHGQWQARLVEFLGALRLVAAVLVTIVSLAGLVIVIFATRGGLLAHRQTIELLHLFGAHDAYIAGQFAVQAMLSGFKGGLGGVIATAITIVALGQGASATGAVLPNITVLAIEHWIVLSALPILSAAIAFIAARTTVMRALSRMV